MTDRRTLRVGVTGHRHLASPADVAHQVDALLDRLAAEVEETAPMTAVSSLAEGADRIVAARVLSRAGGALHAVLPLDPADFADDFGDAASRAEFVDLLATAESVAVSPRQESREAAYEHAGRAVLEGCDVLLALWDGQPSRGRGGTAALVTEARTMGRRLEIIHVERRVDAPAP